MYNKTGGRRLHKTQIVGNIKESINKNIRKDSSSSVITRQIISPASQLSWSWPPGHLEFNPISCQGYQAQKGQTNLRPEGFLKPIMVTVPFAKIRIDLLGPFRRRNGHSTIVVATDYATRWVETRTPHSGQTEPVVRFVLEQIIYTTGLYCRVGGDTNNTRTAHSGAAEHHGNAQ